MTARPTADMVAWLERITTSIAGKYFDLYSDHDKKMARKVADRLAELEAGIENVRSLNESLLLAIQRRDAALPPCPTCGGTKLVRGIPPKVWVDCPDCLKTPGKASIERVVALWNDWHDLALSLTNVTEQHPRRAS